MVHRSAGLALIGRNAESQILPYIFGVRICILTDVQATHMHCMDTCISGGGLRGWALEPGGAGLSLGSIPALLCDGGQLS